MIAPQKKEDDNMKKGNVTILTSILAMVLVAAGVGMGTMAWFSDVEMAEVGQVYAGTLDIKIREAGGSWEDGHPVLISVPVLKPGDTFTVDIRLKNIGNMDIQYIYASFPNLNWDGGDNPESEWAEGDDGKYLTKMIVLDGINEYSPNHPDDGWYHNDFTDSDLCDDWLAYWNTHGTPAVIAPLDGDFSLYDLVYTAEGGGGSALTSFRFHTGDELENGVPRHEIYPYLPVGATVVITFEFRLLDETDNRAQGDYCEFDLVFIASNLLNVDDSL